MHSEEVSLPPSPSGFRPLRRKEPGDFADHRLDDRGALQRFRSGLSPRNARAGTHRIMQAGPLVWGRVREDHPHEEDRRHQQQRQCFNDSHDRPSPECVSVPLPSRVEDEHALGAWPEDLDDRFCRSGRRAWSAPPDEPRHDKRADRDHEARRRASHAVNKIADCGPEQRTKHNG